MHRLVGVLGMLTMLGFAFLFSTNRRAIRGKTVAWGLGLQVVFAFLVISWTYGQWIFQKAGAAVNWVLDFAFFGSQFVFGDLGKKIRPWAFSSPSRCCPRSFLSPPFLRCSITSA